MANEKDKSLSLTESELNFLRRHLKNILTEHFDTIDEVETAIASALRALAEYRLSLRAVCLEVTANVPLAAGKGLVETAIWAKSLPLQINLAKGLPL